MSLLLSMGQITSGHVRHCEVVTPVVILGFGRGLYGKLSNPLQISILRSRIGIELGCHTLPIARMQSLTLDPDPGNP